MRKITQQSIQAFLNDFTFNSGNTQVATHHKGTELYLFGNIIAYKSLGQKQVFTITNCGYFTNTTKERLNGLPGVRISQKAGKWFLNGNEWDGKLIEIK